VQLRLRELGNQLDNIFTESFRNLGASFGQSGFAASVDLREQKDRYVARVYVPNGDTSKVIATIDNGALHITMPGAEAKNEAKAQESYEQVITLPQPVRADQLTVERKQNVVVITVPKSTTAVAAVSPIPSPSPTTSSSPLSLANWDERMLEDMRRMQAQMDQVFRNAFPNDQLNGTNLRRLGSTVNVEDQNDKYIVHFALPNRDISSVNVEFKDGRLHLTAQEQKNTSSNRAAGTMQSVESGRYEEMITLPGPVNDSKMTVDRKDGSVVVTLPKA
jgi:HSP20 family molecular chaperone IbpA